MVRCGVVWCAMMMVWYGVNIVWFGVVWCGVASGVVWLGVV